MIEFPSYVQILINGYSETRKTPYIRSDFERGPAKQRRIPGKSIKTVSINISICDENYMDFMEFWDTHGGSWFEFKDPSTNPVTKRKARIVAGDVTMNANGESVDFWTGTLTLEMNA